VIVFLNRNFRSAFSSCCAKNRTEKHTYQRMRTGLAAMFHGSQHWWKRNLYVRFGNNVG
jgi:hypothetical protein